MRNKQICKTINISRRLISLHIIGYQNLEFKIAWRIQSFKPNSLETGKGNLDRAIFKLKLRNKHLELQTFQQLCSMTGTYLGKVCVNILRLPFLKCNKDTVLIIRKRVPSCLKVIFFVMFGGCPSLLNKTLDKVYSKQLRSCDPANQEKMFDLNK